MKRTIIISIATISLLVSCNKKGNFRDASLPIDERVEILLSQMTLEEKTAQLQNRQFVSIQRFMDKEGNYNFDSLRKYYPNGFGGINIDFNFPKEQYVKVANQLQKFNAETRLGIPPLYIGEGLHGLMSNGATVFPQAIALGCMWDTILAEKLFEATAIEARARGIRQLLSPVLDLARDARFGRMEECYSEDPYLVAQMGKAAVNGFQGRTDKPDTLHVAATLKHFVGHGTPEGGRNCAPIDISYFDLLNDHLYPFEACIKDAKVMGLMPSYNEINGVPNHVNEFLIKDLVRKQFNFKGLIVADQNAIDVVYTQHAFAPSLAEAARLAITNTVDIDLSYFSGTYVYLDSLVKSGALPEKVVDDAVRRLLKLKFTMGLFENPYSSVEYMQKVTNCAAHKAIALESAEKAMVLLKNDKNLLPLDSNKIKTVAVIGPMAKGPHFGGYSIEPRVGKDVVSGFETFGNGKFKVLYAEGCKIAKMEGAFWGNENQAPNDEADDRRLISQAVATARQADVVVLAIGEHESFAREGWGEYHRGDRNSIDLLGLQNDLVKEILATGKPVIALMFGGRVLSFNYVAQNVPAIFQVFYLGQEAGPAIANVLFGKVNPSGKLSVTIPKSVGEIPVYYDKKPSLMRSYINVNPEPLYPFGFGLSYTTFEFSAPKIDKSEVSANESVTVSVDVKNTGKVVGEEVVQLYIRDMISSGVRPIMELKDFSKVNINPGETKTIKFVLTPEKLKFYNYKLEKVLEPGDFTVMVGPNCKQVQNVMFKVK